MSRRSIIVAGWKLVGVLVAAVLAVAVIATVQGGGAFGVDFRGTGRPAVFMPIFYIPLLVAFVVAGVLLAVRHFSKGSVKDEASNSTPHTDARANSVLDRPPSARAGERGR